VGVVAVANVALVQVDLAGGRAAALDLDVLHGLRDALATVPRGEVALALRHGVDGLVAGGDEPAGAGGDAALELREGDVAFHLEVAAAAPSRAAGLEEHLDAGDLREPGDLVEREATGELHPRGDGGAADVGPGGGGAGDAGGAVGAGEVPAALEEAEDGAGGGGGRRRGGGGLEELGVGGMFGERGGEGGDARGHRAAGEGLVGAALVDERVDVGARHGQRRVEEEEDGGDQEEKPAGSANAHRFAAPLGSPGLSRVPLSRRSAPGRGGGVRRALPLLPCQPPQLRSSAHRQAGSLAFSSVCCRTCFYLMTAFKNKFGGQLKFVQSEFCSQILLIF
jgi:hypothetical protein